ncbi:hypothetical protein RFI_29239, partial [Reticulomyxa filosa]
MYPLPKTESHYQYILTMIDRFTRYAAAVPLKTNTAKDITLSFANEGVYRHGVPETILSDNGTQFKGKERLVTIAVDRKLDFVNNDLLTSFLPAIVASYNVTPNKMSKVSPHELYGEKFYLVPDMKLQLTKKEHRYEYESLHEYKCTLQRQLQLVREGALSAQRNYNNKRIQFENKNKHKDNFGVCDSVLLFVCDQRVGNKSKLLPKIKSEHGLEKIVHVSKLRTLHVEHENKELETMTAQKLHPLESEVKSNRHLRSVDMLPQLEKIDKSHQSLKSLNSSPPPLEPLNKAEEV